MFRRIDLLAVVVLFTAAVGASAQSVNYTDPNVAYTFDFPNTTWRNVAKPDELRGIAEFVYGDRMEGYLVIRKETVEADTTPSQLSQSDRNDKLHFLPGYVDGKEERFGGTLSGVIITYEFTQSGKAMMGMIYYLQADPRTIYSLRFTGLKDKIARVRNQTDLIARGFRLKT